MWVKSLFVIAAAAVFLYFRPSRRLSNANVIVNLGTPTAELLDKNLDKKEDPDFNRKLYEAGVKGETKSN